MYFWPYFVVFSQLLSMISSKISHWSYSTICYWKSFSSSKSTGVGEPWVSHGTRRHSIWIWTQKLWSAGFGHQLVGWLRKGSNAGVKVSYAWTHCLPVNRRDLCKCQSDKKRQPWDLALFSISCQFYFSPVTLPAYPIAWIA